MLAHYSCAAGRKRTATSVHNPPPSGTKRSEEGGLCGCCLGLTTSYPMLRDNASQDLDAAHFDRRAKNLKARLLAQFANLTLEAKLPPRPSRSRLSPTSQPSRDKFTPGVWLCRGTSRQARIHFSVPLEWIVTNRQAWKRAATQLAWSFESERTPFCGERCQGPCRNSADRCGRSTARSGSILDRLSEPQESIGYSA